MVDRIARVLLVLGVAVLAVGYGFFARGKKLFPYAPLKQAGDAFGALTKYHLDTDYLEAPVDGLRGGVTTLDDRAVAAGPTFLSLYDGNRFVGRLVDLRGNVLHEWRASFGDVWGASPPHVAFVGDDARIQWHGAHLLPDGGLLLNFEGFLFPFGGGLVKLDRDSRVVWRLARNTHHDVEVAADGTIWAAAVNYRPDGMPELPRIEPWFYEDVVLKISPATGEVLDEISVPLALRALPGLLHRSDSYDPTHLNDIEAVPPAMAGAFPMLADGELLLSLRNMNTLVAVDPARKAATWALTGQFRGQHDPDLLPNGRMLVLDNLGGDPACGGSRVLELDAATQAVTWRYDGCGGGPGGLGFGTRDWGSIQPLPNGNVLVVESRRGRVFEVTREAPARVVWVYENVVGERDGRPLAGLVGEARRYAPGELTFLSTADAVTAGGAAR